ncbi:MAG: hypothetical protein H7235_07085 [Bdellovibrionaceae bacterium]|nr:hypothetical protein [Pseudobdellovibrionaceae bacterium]
MGNKSTFVMLFLFATFLIQNVIAETTVVQDICGKSITCTYAIKFNEFLCTHATAKSGQCYPVKGKDKSQCPDLVNVPQQTCETPSKLPKINTAAVELIQPEKQARAEIAFRTSPDALINNPTTKVCLDKSKPAEHYKDKNDKSKGTEIHCVCDYADTYGVINEYPRDTQTDANMKTCPQDPSNEQVVSKDTMNDDVYPCIQKVKDEINKCKVQSSETIKTCSIKSDKNETIRAPIGAIVSQTTSMMHSGVVNKGALEQCKNAGYLSAAAGYGLGQIQNNCEAELNLCKSSCEVVKNYNEDSIIENCKKTGGGYVAGVDGTVLSVQAQKLAATAEGVNNECFQEGSDLSPTAKSLLKSAALGVSQYVSANNAAVQCEQMISAQPQLVPFTNTCAVNPGAAGCPVNCATNPSSAQCTCLTNPQAAGCKGGVGSQLAGNPNAAAQNLPSLSAGGLGSKLGSSGSGGSGGLGDLNMGDASEVNPLDQKPVADAAAGSMFGQAAVPNAGGAGSGEGAKGKNAKGEAGAGEEHGLFGGMFQNLKNAAGNLFGNGGGGGSAASKKSSSVTGGVNSAGLKPIVGNKALRGIASNGKSCFVDSKGTEFCFGKKNMDIFKMMNAQYSNQYNTLIIDK